MARTARHTQMNVGNSAMPRSRKEANRSAAVGGRGPGSVSVNEKTSTPVSIMEGPNTKNRFAGLSYGDSPNCNSGTVDSGMGVGTSRRPSGRSY